MRKRLKRKGVVAAVEEEEVEEVDEEEVEKEKSCRCSRESANSACRDVTRQRHPSRRGLPTGACAGERVWSWDA